MTIKKEKYNPNFCTHKYAQDIVDGNIVCCKAEKQLASQHLKDLKRQGTKAFPYVFDDSRAIRFFKFFESCINPDNNMPYKILPHQLFDEGLLYGWVHKSTGHLRFVKVYKQVAKAQAKTTMSSIKAMWELIAHKIYPPNQPEIGYITHNKIIHLMAVDKKQADELREPIVSICNASPKIRPYIKCGATYIKSKQGGQIQVISKDTRNQQGGKPSFVIIDELSSHVDAKRANIAEGNLGKKGQVLLEIITTAGDNEMSNPAKIEYDYAKRVLSREIKNEKYLAIIREVEEGDNIHDKTVWQKSQPMFRYCDNNYADNLYSFVFGLYERAYKTDDAELKRQFNIFRMNKWLERATNSYLNQKQLNTLDKLAVSQAEWDKLTFGKPKIVGLDYALRRDLTAYGEVFLLEDGRVAIDAHGFMLEDMSAEKTESDKIPYAEWAKLGYLSILDNSYAVIDKEFVANTIMLHAEEKEQDIIELCYDPYKAADLAQDLIKGKYGGNFDENTVLEIGQDIRNLIIPTEKLKNLIITEQLVWNGNPLLKWCFMNCYTVTVTTGKIIDGIKVKKENKDSPRRIDLVASIITALKRVDSLEKNEDNVNYILNNGYKL